ncbi:hypothetical protein LguiA_024979 [Lonicera macranthoides]
MDHDLSDTQSVSKTANSVDLITENSSNSVEPSALETVVVIKSDEACGSIENRDLIDSNLKADEGRIKDQKDEKHLCVIDEKDSIGEKVCRICHLSPDQSNETTKEKDLIQLGCGCKGELGIVHSHCAEAWFKLRGNRLCEICGEIAKNISGVGDNRFMEDWNNRRSSSVHASERRGGCWRGQPFCNFLLACLVIAFVLPWFFRVSMF